jgi:hypothetical protein
VATNFWIFKSALRPLTELSGLVRRLQAGEGEIDPRFLSNTDPDISQLANAIDSLIRQLEERNRQLRALSERSINAQEEERRKIALTLMTKPAGSFDADHSPEQLESRISPPRKRSACIETAANSPKIATDLRKIVYGATMDDLDWCPLSAGTLHQPWGGYLSRSSLGGDQRLPRFQIHHFASPGPSTLCGILAKVCLIAPIETSEILGDRG